MIKSTNGKLAIVLTMSVAFILELLPLPAMLAPARPLWPFLVTLYWVVALPHRFGVLMGFVVGLFLDVIKGAVLGQHALVLSILIYGVLIINRRFRYFPRWKQALIISSFSAVYLVFLLWIGNVFMPRPRTMEYWYPIISTGFVWPLVYPLLKSAKNYLGVT